MKKIILLLMFSSTISFAADTTLSAFSVTTNKTLPEKYDNITVLRSTTVENNNFYYHFLLNANHDEFKMALPKVHSQILKTVCGQSRERTILKGFKANLIYRYENQKGQSLGEFMVQPSHCK